MKTIIIAMPITNVIILIMALAIRGLNKVNIKDYENNIELLNKVYIKLKEDKFIKKTFLADSKESKKIKNVFKQFTLNRRYKEACIDDTITDRDVLQFLEMEYSVINKIEKEIKPYIRLRKIEMSIENIGLCGVNAHMIISFLYILTTII